MRYRRGEKWFPDQEFETAHIEPEQAARYEEDVREEPISEHLKGRDRVSIYDLARHALFITTDRIRDRRLAPNSNDFTMALVGSAARIYTASCNGANHETG